MPGMRPSEARADGPALSLNSPTETTSPSLLSSRRAVPSPARIRIDGPDSQRSPDSPGAAKLSGAGAGGGVGSPTMTLHSPSPGTSPNARFAHSVPHTPAPRLSMSVSPDRHDRSASLSIPAQTRAHAIPAAGTSAAEVAPKGPAVLIPTDRPVDQLLHRWMHTGRKRHFRVDCEMRLAGYGLWTDQSWYLSRSRFSQSILTLTHKPSDVVSVYRLVPSHYYGDGTDDADSEHYRDRPSALEGGMSKQEAEAEVAALLKELMQDVKGQVRKTEWGSCIISTPLGTTVFNLAAGDLRAALPTLMLTDGLRRLNCSGRSNRKLEMPSSSDQRKFYETYRIPQLPNTPSTPSSTNTGIVNAGAAAASSLSSSNTAGTAAGGNTVQRQRSLRNPAVSSPVARDGPQSASPQSNSSQTITSPSGPAAASPSPMAWRVPLHAWQPIPVSKMDPFHLLITEFVRLIQASLTLWGLFPFEDGVEIDGLFCDVTKQGMDAWRAKVGWVEDDATRKERDDRHGCIEPKALAGLLSSVTSTYYQLSNLDVDGRLPKDPFTKVDKFLNVWQSYQEAYGHVSHGRTPHRHLSVPLLRALATDFAAERARSGPDPLKVPRLIKATVANAASAIKLGLPDDGPLRKREQLRSIDEDADSYGHNRLDMHDASDLIVSSNSTAPPNVLSSNLEGYTQCILRTNQKDLPELGARRLWVLWAGHVDELVRTTEVAAAKHAEAVAARQAQATDSRAGHHQVFGQSPEHYSSSHGYAHGYAHARKNSRGTDTEGEGVGYGPAGVRAVATRGLNRASTVLKGLVPAARRSHTLNVAETSDSEAATARGVRKKQSLPVPTVIEPMMSSQEQLTLRDRNGHSLSPSPSTTLLGHPRPNNVRSGSYLTTTSAVGSKRPSINTALTNGSERSVGWLSELDPEHPSNAAAGPSASGSVSASRARSRQQSVNVHTDANGVHRPVYDHHPGLESATRPRPSQGLLIGGDLASTPIRMSSGRHRDMEMYRTRNGNVIAGPKQGTRTRTRRFSTASDGADVQDLTAQDHEWRIMSPHGTGKGHREELLVHAYQREVERKRRHSWHVGEHALGQIEDDEEEGDRETTWEHLRIDVELAYTTFTLRKREKELAKRAQDLKKLETIIFHATQKVVTALHSRRAEMQTIEADANHLIDLFEKAPHDMVDGSVAIQELESRIRYRITEDGGDSSKLSTGYTSLRDAFNKAKEMWEVRTGIRAAKPDRGNKGSGLAADGAQTTRDEVRSGDEDEGE